ncbi:MAG: type II secretion system F family protein [Gemmatimonadetes bacterium]|nr:type II secretion system F family protein [Gemmatimonadota bacterium]
MSPSRRPSGRAAIHPNSCARWESRCRTASVRSRQASTRWTMTGVPAREVTVFTRLFSTMIGAGLPIVPSLNILARQTKNRAFRKVIQELLYDVQSGDTLAGAMRRHPRVFSELSVNMVAAGEAAGALDTILQRLSDVLEKTHSLARKVRAALIYPAMIIAVTVPAVAILLVFVIPTFETMFASAGVPLPVPTRVVIGASGLIQGYWWVTVLFLLAALAAAVRVRGTERGRLLTDRVTLGIPILGDLLRKAAVARFTRTLGTLVASGVSILEGLEVTANTAGNRVIRDAVMKSRASIAGGATIAGPLEESGAFTPMVVRMVEVGEQTGGLDDMLTRVADFYDQEVDAALEVLVAAVEPVMIVVLGIVVGGIIVAMYLPIFDMMKLVG